MAMTYIDIPAYGDFRWRSPVASASALPTVGVYKSEVRWAVLEANFYIYNGTGWDALAGGGGGGGALTQAQFTNTGTIPLAVSTGIVTASLSASAVAAGANQAKITFSNQADGLLGILTTGSLTEATSSVLTITGGTGSQVGGATSIQVKKATTSVDGYLAATDFTTFNNKQAAITTGAAGTYIKGDTLTAATLNQAAVAGLTTASSPSFAGLTVGAGSGPARLLGGVVSAGNINVATEVTGVLPSANGGTGVNNAGTLTYGASNVTFTTSGATGVTLPTSGTLATRAGTEVLTNKDIDGGTASNTSRLTVPKDITANLTALTRKAGTLVWDTSLLQLKVDDGTNLTALSTGGGGTVTGSGATGTVAVWSSSSALTNSATTTTELGFVSGVTSAIQTQFTGKEPTITAGTSAQYYRGDKVMSTLNQAAVAGLTTADSPTFVATTLSGSTGTGFVSMAYQSATPSTPASNINRLFFTSPGKLQRVDQNGTVETYAMDEGQQNWIINGGFDIAQRSPSVGTASTSPYFIDRWAQDASETGTSWSQQLFTNGGTHPKNARYVLRAAGNGSTASRLCTAQGLDINTTWHLRGRNVTFSGYIRFSAASTTAALGTCIVSFGYTSATTDAAFATTDYQATGTYASTNFVQTALPTGWTYFAITGPVLSATNNICVRVKFTNSVTATSADYYELSNLQLNIGQVPAGFTPASGSVGGELALCQRYAEVGGGGCFGRATSAASSTFGWQYKVPKRVTPAISLLSTTPSLIEITVGSRTGTASAVSGQTPTPNGTNIDVSGFSSMTAGNNTVLTSDSLFASAEL